MEYFGLICALIGILGLILVLFWALRKLNKGILQSGGKRLKILDRAVLGGEKSVIVVSVAGKCMVLGVTAAKIEKIADLDITEEEYLEQLYPAGETNGKSGFFAAFTEALKKNAGISKADSAKKEEKADADSSDEVRH